jgi:SAM-dependent methyltransferase
MSLRQALAPARISGALRRAAIRWYEELERRLWRIPSKQYSEIKWWQQDLDRWVEWYEGKRSELYGVPAPAAAMRVLGDDLRESALLTWLQATLGTYPTRLGIPSDYFRGQRILDVGCGPLPLALGFTECEVYGVDPLIDEYARVGYPFAKYPERMKYIRGGAEHIAVEDDFFDGVISVNAIDHVDNFGAAAKEISRVLRPGGTLRMEVHYHDVNVCEPWALSDAVMLEHYGHLGIRKVSERVPNKHERLRDSGERLVVWATSG